MGRWIAPNGQDVTYDMSDLFEVSVGGELQPGHVGVELREGYSLTTANQGVYTCAIPDEADREQFLTIGIYPYTFNGVFCFPADCPCCI